MEKKHNGKSREIRRRRNNLLYANLNYNGTNQRQTDIRSIVFDEKSCETHVVSNPSDLTIKPGKVNWIRINGLSDEKQVETLCNTLGLPFTTIQDILNVRHISKIEDTGKMLFAVADAYSYSETQELLREHHSIVLGEHFVLTFEEGDGHRFEPVLKAVNENIGQVRSHRSDFLFNLLLSLVVDSYFEVLEYQQDGLLEIEDKLMEFEAQSRVTSQQIQYLRRDHIRLQKALSPLRDAFSHFLLLDSGLIHPQTGMYFRDTYDHLHQVMSMLDSNRELLSTLMDLYLANNDLRMNLIMKQLTVVATIFIPLTFLVGVWGMNFANMPELNMPHGYFLAWGLMIALGVLLYLRFRRKYKV